MQYPDQRYAANRIDQRTIPGMGRKGFRQGNQKRHGEQSGDELRCVEILVEYEDCDESRYPYAGAADIAAHVFLLGK